MQKIVSRLPWFKFLNPQSSILNPRSGFTVLETLVVLGVTTIIASILIIYGSASRNQTALYVEQAKIAQTIFRAKSLAVSTYNKQSQQPTCGFGVHIDYRGNAYILFRYGLMANDCRSFRDGSNQIFDYEPARRSNNITEITSSTLSANLTFVDRGSTVLRDVIFIPPDPTTKIFIMRSSSQFSGTGNVALQTGDGLATAAVRVSPAGQVDF